MVETSLTVLIIVEGQKPASVELKRVDRNLTVRCNCSSEDKICNHIISTLFGEEARIVGCDGTLTKTIADMLRFSPFGTRLRRSDTLKLLYLLGWFGAASGAILRPF